MKRTLLFFLLACSSFPLFSQVIINGKIDAIEEFTTPFEFEVPMPDGVKLATSTYLPITQDCLTVNLTIPLPAFLGGDQDLGNVELIPRGVQYIIYDSLNGQLNPDPYQLPAVFTRTPYEKRGDQTGPYVALFGYASIVQDMRGRYESEGVYMPMYSDSWDKNPYHPDYGHILDVTDLTDPKNGNKHEDGYNTLDYIVNGMTRDFGSLQHTNNLLTNGNIAMFGASALGNSQYQAAAAHRIDPNAKGLKAILPIVATVEHYRYTGFQNGVFRDRIVTGWLKGQIFTGIEDDFLPIDNGIHNNIHTSFDYGLPNKFEAARLAIDHFTSIPYGTSLPGYFPNSKGRADMDASAAPVDANGEGDPNGEYSRYTNMDVPGYHLTGWWDIFTDGQIETFNQMRTHISPRNAGLQKLIIGPWAHQTIGNRTTGDITYPENVSDILRINLDDLENSLNMSDITRSEFISWFRFNLNYLPGQEIGEPTVLIPESQRWQDFGNIEVRIPSRDYKISYLDLFNFLTGNSDLVNVPVEVKEKLFNNQFDFDLTVPNSGPLIDVFDTDKADSIPYKDYINDVPTVRFYVPGPVGDGVPENANVGNYWFSADRFPLVQHIRWEDKFLHQDGSITDAAPTSDEGYKIYVHDPDDPILTLGGGNMIVKTPQGDRDSQGQMNLADPNFASHTMDRQGVISFETPMITDSLFISGYPQFSLWAKSDPAGSMGGPTDTDFMVRVLDVYPDGREFFVVEGAVNARARDYARKIAKTGKEDPNIPFTNIQAGQLYEYEFEMMPISYVWGKNHKLKVLVSSSNYTRYQVNPNLPIEDGAFFRRKPGDGQTYNFQGTDMAPRVAVQRVHFSPDHPCKLKLPVYDPTFFVAQPEELEVNPGLDALVWPNPASDHFSVYLNQSGKFNYRLLDMLGREIEAGMMRGEKEFVLNGLEKGIYLLNLEAEDGNGSLTKKIIVQ